MIKERRDDFTASSFRNDIKIMPQLAARRKLKAIKEATRAYYSVCARQKALINRAFMPAVFIAILKFLFRAQETASYEFN
jgi:hypothetical protein